jgi:catechol 2,3-dioxygenase-like lactoylglutathione lyase family enzyme
MAIKRVSTVSVFVSDQDRARDFYTQVLGFELRRDALGVSRPRGFRNRGHPLPAR